MKRAGTTEVMQQRGCWNCGAPVESLYLCNRCATLQRFPEKIDYFTLFGIEPQLNIDLARLEAAFYELSRKFHPDFYQKKSSEEQAISLENSAILNKSYRTLKDPIQRVEYLIRFVEGGSAVASEAPADLFDEIFELQELLEGVKRGPGDAGEAGRLLGELKSAEGRFLKIQEEGNRSLERLSIEWDRLQKGRTEKGLTEEQRRSLSEMKQILSRRAYLERILNDIQTGIGKLEKGN